MSQLQQTLSLDQRNELRGHVRERVVSSSDTLAELRSKRPAERDAIIAVDRTRWMAIAFVAMAFAVVLLFAYINANNRAQNNLQTVWVRMYPDGHLDTDFYDSNRDVEFLPATVDHLISGWVIRRYQENPTSVQYDYGYAQLFMDPKAAAAFLDPKQGNAVARAAAITKCSQCARKEIEIRTINHFDSEQTTFGRMPGALYRSNVFITEKSLDDRGTLTESHRKIVSMQWRLMSKAEIQNIVRRSDGMEWLRKNPIGLQIIGYELLADPSDKDVSTAFSNSTSASSKE